VKQRPWNQSGGGKLYGGKDCETGKAFVWSETVEK